MDDVDIWARSAKIILAGVMPYNDKFEFSKNQSGHMHH